MSVEGQAVNGVLVFKVKSIAKNLINFVVDLVSSDADDVMMQERKSTLVV